MFAPTESPPANVPVPIRVRLLPLKTIGPARYPVIATGAPLLVTVVVPVSVLEPDKIRLPWLE